MIKIKRGLDLPISGKPEQHIHEGENISSVAVLGADFSGMKPTMKVREGDTVKKGQVLFEDKKNPSVQYTAPAAGTIVAINRGAKRVFESLVINVESSEEVTFKSFDFAALPKLSGDEIIKQLLESGEWTAIRQRPYDKVPSPNTRPASIFITAIDTRPLAADPQIIINEHAQAFVDGVNVLSRLTDGKTFVCKAENAELPSINNNHVLVESFQGKHPAGLVGTHIHYLDPVSADKTVWHIGYQDVIAIGYLFTTGKIYTDRVVALSGPQVKNPRLVKTQRGASLVQLTDNQVKRSDTGNRLISGSVLDGYYGHDTEQYLGRYANQVSVLTEGTERQLFGYLSLGTNKHSVMSIYLSSLFKKLMPMTTTTNGSERAMLPLGMFEQVMPLDILPTQLLRAIVVGDLDTAVNLGALELAEEDLALCTYACPGKYEYGPLLRDALTTIEKEG